MDRRARHRVSLEPVRHGIKEGDHRTLFPLPDEGRAGDGSGHHPVHVEPKLGEGPEPLADRGVPPDQHGSGEQGDGCARRIAEEPGAPSRQDEEARHCHPELGQAMNPPRGPHDRCALQSGDGPIVLEGLADDRLGIEGSLHGELGCPEVQDRPGDPRKLRHGTLEPRGAVHSREAGQPERACGRNSQAERIAHTRLRIPASNELHRSLCVHSYTCRATFARIPSAILIRSRTLRSCSR